MDLTQRLKLRMVIVLVLIMFQYLKSICSCSINYNTLSIKYSWPLYPKQPLPFLSNMASGPVWVARKWSVNYKRDCVRTEPALNLLPVVPLDFYARKYADSHDLQLENSQDFLLHYYTTCDTETMTGLFGISI